jgi:putative membrane protein
MLGPMKILLRWFLLACALLLVTRLDSGVHIHSFGTALAAALVLGLLNALLRPLLVVLTLPVTLLSLGLFLLVINAALFGLAARLMQGFTVATFWDALVGSLIYSLSAMVIDAALEHVFKRPWEREA